MRCNRRRCASSEIGPILIAGLTATFSQHMIGGAAERWRWAARPIQAGCILAPLAGRIVIGYDNPIRILSSQWGFRRIRFVFAPTSGFLDESDSQTIPIRQFGESVAPYTLLWDNRRNGFVYLELGRIVNVTHATNFRIGWYADLAPRGG